MPANKVALTYSTDTHTDGAGAQLQRIYGIYALCKALDIKYVHSPIETISYYGVLPLDETQKQRILAEYDSTFSIPADDVQSNYSRRIGLANPTLEDLAALNITAEDGTGSVLGRITLPYAIMDANPHYYDACKAISPFRNYQRRGPVRVAIHLRRGDLKFIAPDRIIPNSYYVTASLRIGEILAAKGLETVFELHTEVGDVAHFPPEWFSGRVPARLDFQDNLHDFSVIPNLEVHYDEPAIKTIEMLSTADVLLMSKSSFSYVAAILSPGATIFYLPFVHAKMADWVLASEDGAFDEAQFVQQISSRF